MLIAEDLLELALQDPAAAVRAADELLATRPDPLAAAVAHRAAGLALADIDELSSAAHRFRLAIALATKHDLPRPAAQARMSLAVALAGLGQLPAALRELDVAGQALSGTDAAEVLAQRALLLGRAGRYKESMDAYRRALPVLRGGRNVRFEALALLNRGALRSMHGDLREADADLRRCADLARRGRLTQLLADAENNLGYLAACRGDIPTALEAFARAEAVPGIGPGQAAATRTDRATALLRVGLADEAAADAAAAIVLLERGGRRLDAASARLLLAEARLAGDDPSAAAQLAAGAAREFRSQHRPAWAAQAVLLSLRAKYAAGDTSAGLLRALRVNLDDLDRHLGPPNTRPARLFLARVLLDHGRDAQAEAEAWLEADWAGLQREPAQVRVAAWTVRALMDHQNSDDAAASRAVRSGLAVVVEYAAALGATELRAAAAADGRELAELGVRLALRGGRPAEVLRAAEALRSRSLDHPPTRAPDDRVLAADLAALRRTVDDQRAEGVVSAELRAEQVRLERTIRQRTHGSPGPGGSLERPIEVNRVVAALAGRTLVSYLRSGDNLHAVTVHNGRSRVHRLGPWAPVAQEVAAVRFSAHRLWRAQGNAESLAAAREALAHAAHHLDELLLKEVTGADAGLVLAPVDDLHALPWSLLPSTVGRPVQVIPSLAWWLTPRQDRRRTGEVFLAAGPRLRHAGPEIRAITAHHPQASVLIGPEATVDAVLAGLDGTGIAHLACHGRFRADQPDFSSLELADGPLTVHDLHRLRRPPRLLVLSACEAARCAVRPGGELLGVSAALLKMGTRTLIAPVTAVPDRETRVLMTALHRWLAAGDPPAVALSRATADTGVAGFICFGGI